MTWYRFGDSKSKHCVNSFLCFYTFISNGFLTFWKKIYSSHFVTFFPLSFTINQPKDFNNKSQITSLKLEQFIKTVIYVWIGLIVITKLAHHVRGGKHFKKRLSLYFTVKHNTIRYLWPVFYFMSAAYKESG